MGGSALKSMASSTLIEELNKTSYAEITNIYNKKNG